MAAFVKCCRLARHILWQAHEVPQAQAVFLVEISVGQRGAVKSGDAVV